jgi:hypothetical protein
MGADMYLNSIWNPWVDAHRQDLLDHHGPDAETVEDFIHELDRISEEFFDKARSSGGYFRNGYNSGDVMWAMGLSWREDVGKMLDSKCRLSIDHARALIAKIEARPLTRERVAQHIFEHLSDGSVTYRTGFTEHGPPPNLDEMFAFLGKRRYELLTILRKSVELGEPLVCSL